MSPQYSQLKGGVTSAMREGSHGWDIVFKINVLSSRGVFESKIFEQFVIKRGSCLFLCVSVIARIF